MRTTPRNIPEERPAAKHTPRIDLTKRYQSEEAKCLELTRHILEYTIELINRRFDAFGIENIDYLSDADLIILAGGCPAIPIEEQLTFLKFFWGEIHTYILENDDRIMRCIVPNIPNAFEILSAIANEYRPINCQSLWRDGVPFDDIMA